MARLQVKEKALRRRVRELERVVIGYSGGVDSAFLAAVAHEELGEASLAATADSPALARSELTAAISLARIHGWNHLVVATGELDREDYARNAPDRCFWCKTELFSVLAPVAARRDARMLTGTNADDLGDYRPGLSAAEDRSVITPLAEVRLTKVEIRELSRAMGLPTADKPSSPCLASRFAYGVRVTEQGLRRIERAEEFLRVLGFQELRVRDHGDLARIEVPAAELEAAFAARARIIDELRSLGFRYVTLDLEGFRSGSLNEVLTIATRRPS